MDADTLRSLALRGGGFSTPRLNDSLQAHGAGLSGFFPSWSSSSPSETAAAGTENKESPLAAYRCLRSLNLADNGLESLKGMPRLEDLRCLFIERNCLHSLAGLARAAPRLATLDAGANRVTGVGVESLLPRSLETLRLSGNDLSGPEALRGLFHLKDEAGEGESSESSSSSSTSSSVLPLLSTLDLSHCSIADAETLLALLESLPSLRALYLQGNPFWESMGGGANSISRRLAVLAAAPHCTYLNDSPVFGDERAAADAFRESKGSVEAASAARARFLEAAALEGERTTRLLERPPRFVRLAEEEAGDEEPDEEGEESEDEEEMIGKKETEGGASAAAAAAATAPEKGNEAEA